MKYELALYHEGEHVSTYPVNRRGSVVGRAADCDIMLNDTLVSRHHACIWIEDDTIKIEDMGSRNGMSVNGERVAKIRLSEGDEVVVGTHTLVVGRVDEAAVLEDTGAQITFEHATDMYETMVREQEGGAMAILYNAAQLLGTVFDLDDLLDRLLALVTQALPTSSAYILTLGPGAKKPAVRASIPKIRTDDDAHYSKTLVNEVIQTKTAILTINAQQDFSDADSIMAQDIRGVMCVPLCGRTYEVIGAIYVDSGEDTQMFKNDDLKLLTAIGRVTGVAVENALLHQQAGQQERLAAIGQATAGLGHCAKNILTGMKGGGELIDIGIDSESWKTVAKGWPLIRRSIDRIEDLVTNLMTYSRDRKPEFAPVDLGGLVQEAVASVQLSAEAARVKVFFEPSALDPIPLDRLSIYRAILNLLTNAVDACGEDGGEVTVTTRADANAQYVSIKDTGSGIPDELLPRIFDAFVSSKGARGTGLGLACSDKIVREHGGRIQVQTRKDLGTTMTIRLPMPAPQDLKVTLTGTVLPPETD